MSPISYRDVQDETHVADLRAGEVFEDGDEIEEFVVVRVAEPGGDGDGVVGMEDV